MASREANSGPQHLNNDIVVTKMARNAVCRIPSIRLRDTETLPGMLEYVQGWRAASLRSDSGILKRLPNRETVEVVTMPHPFDPTQGY